MISRSFSIIQVGSIQPWRNATDVLIEPDVHHVLWDEFVKTPQLVAAGQRRRASPCPRSKPCSKACRTGSQQVWDGRLRPPAAPPVAPAIIPFPKICQSDGRRQSVLGPTTCNHTHMRQIGKEPDVFSDLTLLRPSQTQDCPAPPFHCSEIPTTLCLVLRWRCVLALAAIFLLVPACFAQTTPTSQTFPLTDTAGLIPRNVKVSAVEYKGRKAVLVTNTGQDDGFALLPGVDFQDGTIEADLAVQITTPPGVRMPGFLGIAFRARPDASHYELFYLRPKNSTSSDQGMRNHSLQYSEAPDFGWYKLRREWPFVYEAYAPLQVETWTKIKIEVKGRTARLYLNGSDEPSLVVNGLKGDDLHGASHCGAIREKKPIFRMCASLNAAPEPVKNGSDATGTWHVKYPSDYWSLRRHS